MQIFLVILCLLVTIVSSAPRYGEDGAYVGFASYVPPPGAESKTDVSLEDTLDSSAGSPDISRRPSHSAEDASKYEEPTSLPERTHRPQTSRPFAEDTSSYQQPTSVPTRTKSYPSSRPSSEESSSYERPTSVPTRTNSYPPSRPSSEESSSYERPNPVPKPITAYKPRPSSKDPASYEQAKPVPNQIDSHQSYEPAEELSLPYPPNSLPKKYDALNHNPEIQYEYQANKIPEDEPAAPYQPAKIHSQSEGGYKIADAYKNHQPLSSEEDGVHLKNGYEDKQVEQKAGYAGGSEEYHDEDDQISNPQPYEYGYALKDKYGNSQHRHEEADGHGSVKGSYGFMDEHGRYRSVQYVADKDGFRASVMTNEPGTENKNPADVKIKIGDH